jgi:hypothetical protein
MLGRSRTQAIKDNAVSGGELALALARDRKFREQLAAAIAHGAAARRRAASRVGLMAAAARLAADEELRGELAATIDAVQEARRRVDKKRSHTLRTTLLVVVGSAGAFALFKLRSKMPLKREGSETTPQQEPAAPAPAPVPAAEAQS